MCGRFVTTSPASDVAAYFDAVEVAERLLGASPRYNVAPTTDVAVVVEHDGRRVLEPMRWGLVPGWADDLSIGSRMINARVETAATKPSFRRAFARRRCIVPVDGFYEWRAAGEGRPKQPFFIHRRDHEPLAVAGLWETWQDRSDPASPVVATCALLTTEATGPMVDVHHRMPVLVGPTTWDRWLAEDLHDPEEVRSLLGPTPDDLLALRPVSTAVNSVRNQGPELVDEVPPADAPDDDGPARLF